MNGKSEVFEFEMTREVKRAIEEVYAASDDHVYAYYTMKLDLSLPIGDEGNRHVVAMRRAADTRRASALQQLGFHFMYQFKEKGGKRE